MKRLLHAGLARIFHSTLLRVCLLAAGGFALFAGRIVVHTAMNASVAAPAFVEDIMVSGFPMLPYLCAAFIALLLGAEYEHGTMRNKLTVGHTRADIYFSGLTACAVAALAMLAVILFCGGALVFFSLGEFLLDPPHFVLLLVICVMASIEISTLCAALSLNISSRAISVVLLFSLLYGMFLVSAHLESALRASELMYEYVNMTNEGIEYGPLIPNPNYIDGTRRVVYEFLWDLLPTSLIAQISNSEFEHCSVRWFVLSLGVTFVTAAAGYSGFRKKDIK